jgi:hypothetical protein
MGRGHEAEVRINDISVSRCHAYIKFIPNSGFHIEDNNSKFGTIVKLKEPYCLKKDTNVSLQAGRTIISMICKEIEVRNLKEILPPKVSVQIQETTDPA